MTSLSIGKAIYTILSSNEELTTLLGGDNKIFPLIVNTDTQLPFIVYKRLDIDQVDTKDKFICQEAVNVQFAVVSEKYNKGVEIAEKLNEVLTKKDYKNMGIVSVTLNSADEEYSEDSFVQVLTYKILIK